MSGVRIHKNVYKIVLYIFSVSLNECNVSGASNFAFSRIYYVTCCTFTRTCILFKTDGGGN